MATQIRPNRLEVSDRFPMLGFTVRTDGSAKRFEIAIGTSPDLFGPDGRSRRSRSTFYSTRAIGPLPVERGEAVYVLPAEVLARFVGQEKLYYGLATFSNGVGTGEVASIPKIGSPYINIGGLTGRSLQRVRLLPSRQRAASNYGKNGSEMEWSGDAAVPGTQPAAGPASKAAPGKDALAPTSTEPVHYDDGYGPLPSSTNEPKLQAKSPQQDVPSTSQEGEHPTPRATALRQVDPGYSPSNTTDALQYMQQFQDRKQAWKAGVSDTTFFPHSAICRFRIFQKDGEYIGTGFYIAKDRILTCAHNVANATSVTIIPGKNDAAEPFGSFTVQPSDWAVHPKYDPSTHDFDLAVINVSTPPPNGEAFTILEELLECQGNPIIVCGYAADTVNENKQHLDGDAIRLLNDTDQTFLYNLQTEPGNSGSPVYYVSSRDDDVRQMCVLETHLVGVHVASVVDSKILNEGCRLTAEKIAWINSVGKPFSAGAQSLAFRKKKRHYVRATSDDLQPATLPPAKKLTGWQKTALRTAIDSVLGSVPPVSTVLPLLIRLVNEQGFTVGIGLGGDAGLLGGAGLGFGVLLAPNDDVGVFGEVEVSAGLLAGVSAGSRIIVIHGGIDAFNDTGYALGVTVEEGASISATALFNSQREFHGVSFQLGIGAALSPIQIFTSVEKSVSAAVTQSLAAAATSGLKTSHRASNGYASGASVIARPMQEQAAPASTTSGIGSADPATSRLSCVQGLTDQGRSISFVQRYLRNLARAEATALSDAGLPIVSCYEENGSDPPATYFTRAQGQHDGRRAFTQAQAVGQPAGTPIYFALDTDPTTRQKQIILDYFQGVQEGCAQYLQDMEQQGTPGVVYDIGVYGSRYVLQWCQTQGIATWFWQAFAPGWSDGTNRQVWPDADIHTRQRDTPPRCGGSLDYLEGWGHEGGWTYNMAAAGQALSVRLPAPPPRKRYAYGHALDAEMQRMIGNSPISTISGAEGNITWQLDQFPGTKSASSALGSLQSAETIQLSKWPYCEHGDGSRSCAGFSIDWKFSGHALGQVRIVPSGIQQGAQPLRVEARIEEAKNRDSGTASLMVRFTYHFSTSEGPEVVAMTELTLFSDGSVDQKSNWVARAAA